MNQTIRVEDSCSVQSYINSNEKKIIEKLKVSPCVGLVRIIQDGKVVSIDQTEDGWLTNVTVGIGREFIAQRAFGLPSGGPNLSGPATADVTAYTITHFGIGSGGTAAGPPPTLITPAVADTKLNAPLKFNAIALDFDSGSGIQLKAGKPITPSGSIIFNTDPLSANHFTTVKCTCLVGASEPAVNELGAILTTGNAAKIDEAMLFASSGVTLIPFAHISFMPKFIEFESSLTIEWNIIF